jgi:hypothetical protein
MKNAVFLDVMPYGCLWIDVSEEWIAPLIMLKWISKLGTVLHASVASYC